MCAPEASSGVLFAEWRPCSRLGSWSKCCWTPELSTPPAASRPPMPSWPSPETAAVAFARLAACVQPRLILYHVSGKI